MKFPLAGLKRLYLPLAAFFLLLIPFALYFFFYVEHQKSYYTHRNVRDLAVVSRQISEQMRSYQRVLQNRADYVGRVLSANSVGAGPNEPSCELTPISADKPRAEAPEPLRECLVKPYIEDRVPGLSYVKPEDATFLREDMTLVRDGAGFEVYFLAEAEDRPRGKALLLHAKTSLRQFGDQFRGHGEFESILLLDGGGTVLYQSEHPELRVTQIAALTKDNLTAATGVTNLTLGDVDYSAFVQPVDIAVATREPPDSAPAGGIEPTGRGKTSTARADSDPRQRWIVCGLVAKAQLDGEAQAISYSVVIWFVFILAILTFLAPFLKLRFLAPTERLPRWEGPKLLVAVLLGAAAVSVCILDVYYYNRLVDEVDESLVQLADRMESNFTDEVTRAHRQLVEYDSTLPDTPADACDDKRSLGGILKTDEVDTDTYPYISLIIWADTDGDQRMKWSVRGEPTTFIPVGGREYFQRVKDHDRSIRELPRLRGKDGGVGRIWLESLFSWTTGANEVVISTGVRRGNCSGLKAPPLQMVAGVFQPLSVTAPVLPRGYGFAIVDREGNVLLHSDRKRILTENFFIEADEERELRSAVQGRIAHTMRIRYFGKDHRVHARPLKDLEGLGWSLLVFHPMKPLRTLNLEVLTLTAVLFGLYLLILLLAVWWVFAGLLGGLLWFLDPGKALSVLWPDKKTIGIYRRLWAFYTATAVVFLIWIAISTGLTLVVGAVLIPLYSFLSGLLADWFEGKSPTDRTRWALFRRAPALLLIPLLFAGWSEPHLVLCLELLLAAFLLQDTTADDHVKKLFPAENLKPYMVRLTVSIVVLAVLPSIAFFKFGYRLERHLWQMHSQQVMAEDLQSRSARVRKDYHSLLPDGGTARLDFLNRRLYDEELDVYAAFDTTGSAKPCGVWSPCVTFNPSNEDFAGLSSADSWGDKDLRGRFQPARPLYDDFAGHTWPLLTPPSSVRMVRDKQGRRWIHTLAADGSVELRSPAASMALGFGWSELAGLLAWLLLLYTLHWGVRFIARMVFLIDLPSPKRRKADLDSAEGLRGNLFILGHPRSGKTDALTGRDDVYPVELTSTDGSLEDLPPDKAVAIDQFEYQMDDATWNQKKLRMLEDLVYRRPKDAKVTNPGVIVVSTIEPIFYLTTGGSGKPVKNGEEPNLDLDRWANVLSSVDVYDFEDWTKVSLEEELKTLSPHRKPADESQEAKKKAGTVDKICNFLSNECRWTAPLRRAAKEVVSNIDPAQAELPSTKALADQIYDHCEAYYRSLWSACSKAEKRMLIQLAEEGVLNRKEERVVRHLMKKGLIDRRPRLTLLNETFRRFVLDVKEEEQDFTKWEQEHAAQGWAAWRSALIVVLVTVVVFLGATQQEILESWLPILGAIATGVAGILRVFTLFHRGATPALD